MNLKVMRWGAGLFLVGLLLIFALCALRPMWNSDVYWHIVAGHLISQNGALPEVDTFSAFRPDRPWITFQWGYQVLVSWLDSLGGLEAVRIFHIAGHVLAFAFAGWLAYRRHGAAAPLGLAILMVTYLDRIRARPHLFNLIGALLLVYWLGREFLRIRRESEPGDLRGWQPYLAQSPLVVLGVLWSNIHAGGSLLYPVVLGAFCAGLWAARHRAALHMTAVGGLTLFLMSLSPGFVPGVVQAVSMYGETKALIPEWQPGWVYLFEPQHPIHPIMGGIPWVCLSFLLLRLRKMSRADLPALLVSLVLLVFAIRGARFLYLAALVPLFWPWLFKVEALAGQRVLLTWLLAGFLGGAFAHEHLYVQRESPSEHFERMGKSVEAHRYPIQAGDFLSELGLEGKILHQSDWGGYLLYEGYPKVRVAADGRGNLGPDLVDHLIQSHRMRGRAEYLLESLWQFPVDLLVFPPTVFELDQYNRDDFLLAYADPQAEIYLVRGPQFEKNLARLRSFYRPMVRNIVDPLQKPALFEIQVRRAHSLSDQVSVSDAKERSRLQSILKTEIEGPRRWAAALELASLEERLGDLPGAVALLRKMLKQIPYREAISQAVRIRLSALLVRLQKSNSEVRAVFDTVEWEKLSPYDRHLGLRVKEVVH